MSKFKKILGTLFATPLLIALRAGDVAPDFSAKNQDGKIVRLSDFKNKAVVLYFYPKDETPGCTKEACSFRDDFSKYQASGAVVLGVSAQGEKSHQEFKAKHRLPFDLLVDSDGTLAKTYGVDRIPVIGLHKRQTILIGADRKILKFYDSVDPRNHSEQILTDLKELSAKK